LAKEKEDLRLKVEPAASPGPLPSAQTESAALPGPALIQLSADKGSLVRVGNGWQQKTERITVSGYELELAKGLAITMVQIPAGSFQMGSPATESERASEEGPQHRVQLQSFFLGQTPLTQAQWQAVANWSQVELKLNPNPARFKGANRPVGQVRWEEAMEFCRRLSQRAKLAYTLPSEAQWEYACRAGSTTPFAFGDTLTPDFANFNGIVTYGSGPKGQYRQQTKEVGSFPANAWGLQDMHGNVWEWCLDPWHDSCWGAPADGSAWTAGGGTARLLRGGSWLSIPRLCRSAFRFLSSLPDSRLSSIGFRVCCLPQD
jgi:formylglycine-generating enzyme required for sulfatase activity